MKKIRILLVITGIGLFPVVLLFQAVDLKAFFVGMQMMALVTLLYSHFVKE